MTRQRDWYAEMRDKFASSAKNSGYKLMDFRCKIWSVALAVWRESRSASVAFSLICYIQKHCIIMVAKCIWSAKIIPDWRSLQVLCTFLPEWQVLLHVASAAVTSSANFPSKVGLDTTSVSATLGSDLGLPVPASCVMLSSTWHQMSNGRYSIYNPYVQLDIGPSKTRDRTSRPALHKFSCTPKSGVRFVLRSNLILARLRVNFPMISECYAWGICLVHHCDILTSQSRLSRVVVQDILTPNVAFVSWVNM